MVTRLRGNSAGGWWWAALLLPIGWFYFWTAVPEWRPGLIAKTNSSYYNLLTRGFLKGHLSLDLPADPFLATLRNPSDPIERGNHGLHDASYYQGKYYIYFGVTPVLLLFLPFRLLTGAFIDDGLAVPLFACGGLAMAFLLLRAVRARYFRATSSLAFAGCVLALGLANLVPMLLRRTSVWEVPISCGYFCAMTALYALFKAWHSPHRPAWLALASGAMGCAVGSRPTYLLGCSVLLLALVSMVREERQAARPRRLQLFLAACLPIAGVGVGLALYNYLRFGSPLDFGFRHLMNAEQVATERLFSWRFLWYNLRVYALAPAGWSPYFPYVALARLPLAPPGYLAVEDPYGILPNIPFVLLAFGIALRTPVERGRLGIFCAAVLAVAAGTGLMTASFGGAINRYMVDFLPAFIVLACIGLLAVAAQPWFRGWVGALAGAAIGGLLAYSALFNVLASVRHNELFRAEYPALYQRVAHEGNKPSALVDRWLGTAYGPVELKVVFPRDKIGALEPLLVTGRDFLADYLFVHYVSADSVQFGLEHTSRGTLLGPPMKIEPGAVQTLRIDLGSLYPPAGHPYFDAMSPAEALLRQETLRVTCNGEVALERRTPFYDASSRQPSIGSSAGRPGFIRPFSGKIVSLRRLPQAALAAPLEMLSGPLRLELILPPFQGSRTEPLLSMGEPGRGDLIYVRYESAKRISLGYDHWGLGGPVSAPIDVDYLATQVIEIDCGALHPEAVVVGRKPAAERPLSIRLNGRTVFDLEAPFYPYQPYTAIVGINEIGASTALQLFSGNIVKIGRR